jgi:hypothetical protein
VDGLSQTAKGAAGLASALALLYTTLKSANNATPQNQMASVVSNLSAPQIAQVANAVADPGGRNKLISAVGEMPEVKGIVADTNVALNTESEKVVAKVADLPVAAKVAA